MAASRFAFLIPVVIGAVGLFSARQVGDGTPGYYAITVATALVYLISWWLLGTRESFGGTKRFLELGQGILIGLALVAIFVAGAVVVSKIPVLSKPVDDLLATVSIGGLGPTLLVLVLNGIGEELVFRDVVPSQLERSGIVAGTVNVSIVSVVLYTLFTFGMGVPLLILAAIIIGAVAQFEKVRTGHLYSPIALHLTWSTGMLFILPLFF